MTGAMGTVGLAIATLWTRGRAAFPELELDLELFAAHIAHANGPDVELSLLEKLSGEDLYLACACAHGSPGAIAEFERRHASTIERAVRRLVRTSSSVDELHQAILVRLLVPDELGARPRIAGYSGRGSLAAWVSVAAGRTALNTRRDDARETPTGTVEGRIADGALADAHDPELALIRRQYNGAFASALARALAEIDRDHRSLLRLHYGDGLTMDALAMVFGISRSGAHRRVARARDALFDRTCALLRGELAIDTSELESVLRMVKNDLDVSLPGLLQDSTPP